jgi:DNA-binding transcriptional MerR regulator
MEIDALGRMAMSDKRQEKRPINRPKIYSLSATARFARVSVDFIAKCEREGMIQVADVGGAQGYGAETVRRLIRIRHLHRDVGLDLTAIDCILRMRRQIKAIQKRMQEMEKLMIERENELLKEIQHLRMQLARESDWKKQR